MLTAKVFSTIALITRTKEKQLYSVVIRYVSYAKITCFPFLDKNTMVDARFLVK